MSAASGRGRIVAGAIGVLTVIGAALAIAGVFSAEDEAEEAPSADTDLGSIAAPDPAPPPPQPQVRRYAVGGRPDTISAGAGYVWAADSLGGRLQRINPASKQPIAVDAAGFPTDVSAGEGAAWLALADRGAVQRVTGTEGAGEPIDVEGFPFQIAAGEGSVWAMSQTSVERIDPLAEQAAPPVELGREASAIAAGEGGIWVAGSNRVVLKLDPGNGETSATIDVPGAFNVTVGESAVWVLGASAGKGAGGTLTRIEPAGAVAGDPIPVAAAVDVAAGLGFVWVTDVGGKLTRYDTATGAPVGDPIDVGREPQSLSVGEGSVWVAAAGEGTVFRITP
ncbi:MAG: hypothetical protein M3O25_00150 [Actinomycetota bacterium]|nr:hypothetical protein [Actinomycetota bacterium]